MTYASDLGLKVGSKIKVIGDGVGCCFNDGDIIELVEDDGQTNPYFRGDSLNRKAFSLDRYKWEHYKEDESKVKIKFPCCVPTSEIKDAKTLLALVSLFEANGATVYDGVDCGGGHEFDRVDNWDYFGVSLRAGSVPFRTDFYDDFEDYNQSEESSELTIYHVANLLGEEVKATDSGDWIEWNGGEISPVTGGTVVDVKFRNWEEDTDVSHDYSWRHDGEDFDIIAYRLHLPSTASQKSITECLEDNPSVGIDYSVMGSTASTDPLISITQEVKYTVVIKGTTFTFTQEELDTLTEELLGFTTL